MTPQTAPVDHPGRLVQRVCLTMIAIVLSWLPAPYCIAKPWANWLMDVMSPPTPPTDLPPDTSLQLVGARVAINGQIANVWALSSSSGPSWLAQSIETRWRDLPSVTVQISRTEGWQVVSRLVGQVIETAQIRERGQGSYGYLTRWQPSGQMRGSGARHAAWLPRSIELGSEVTSHEPDARVTTIIGTSPRDPKTLLDEVTAFAQSQGLAPVVVERPRQPDSSNQRDSAEAVRADRSLVPPAVLRFTGRAREMVVTIEGNGYASIVVAHLMEVLK